MGDIHELNPLSQPQSFPALRSLSLPCVTPHALSVFLAHCTGLTQLRGEVGIR